jgi:small subunit ribosomal protein S2
MIETISEEKLTKKEEGLVKKMIEAGVYFGHSKSRKNPRMNPYIYTLKENIHIIDLAFSIKKMNQALNFIKEIIKKGGLVLFVGIHPQAKKITKEAAEECNMPYVTERWLGGTLTNFKTIFKRIEHLRDLEKKKATGEFKKYTKKERMLFDQEIEKLNKNLGGIKNLNKLPDAILVLSIKKSLVVIREARRMKVPLIGLADTDSDPTLVDYPIPSNDDAISALEFMLEQA